MKTISNFLNTFITDRKLRIAVIIILLAGTRMFAASEATWENLDKIRDLGDVAMSLDGVFIYVPGLKDDAPGGQIKKAALSAREALKSGNVTVGLFTLSTASKDYTGISKKVQLPAVLTGSKGGRLTCVCEDITESVLIEAFLFTMPEKCNCKLPDLNRE